MYAIRSYYVHQPAHKNDFVWITPAVTGHKFLLQIHPHGTYAEFLRAASQFLHTMGFHGPAHHRNMIGPVHHPFFDPGQNPSAEPVQIPAVGGNDDWNVVITSYSIHYTKLYDAGRGYIL